MVVRSAGAEIGVCHSTRSRPALLGFHGIQSHGESVKFPEKPR